MDPVAAVPFVLPGRRAIPAGLAAGLLVGALFLVPRFDPFGTVAEARAAEEQTEAAAAVQSAAEKRAAELKATDPDADVSPEVAAAVERLARDLKRAKPGEVKANRERLAGQREGLGKLWRQVSAEQLRGLLDEGAGRRTLGADRASKQRAEWKEQLKAGNADGVRDAVRQMLAQAEEAARETDPGRRGEMLKALRERARSLENFARREAGNDPLAEALKQAGAQIARAAEAAGDSPAERQVLARQAAGAAKALLEQAELEAESLARAARDLAELDRAMNAARQASRLNELGQLDGQEATDAASLEEFLAVYEELLAESGAEAVAARDGSVRGEGEGDGEGEGEGEGGAGGDGRGERDEFAPGAMAEDPSAKTGYKTERSQSHLVEGKTLLSLTSKGESDRGERTTEYAAGVQRLKEGVDEAIVAEDVPPGYHDRIKGYFDSLAADAGDGG